MYLRCYPADTWGMGCHQDALRSLAHQAGLPEPALYLDNGARSCEARPALEGLLEQAALGVVDVVLVPGPFVFSLDDGEAAHTVERLVAAGCRVLEIPSPRRTTCNGVS